ncbi:molybdate ABC transporter substrate-binding protein [Catenuloplanes atrovinosus]|uniref:Molybdate transport system substrate-binding protein n=1 Tax=Catenuloplanes atrovinosus TaxID=137266 RepID=A0AAE3YWB1_9ACTN|nr:molybdate ABC transporter substrate-binding protein [Catenuloplanes atrovinosus]MDR7279796.1 molybdate transport system substrate-binding protein [Catenuloplanes atrovinosus]
MRLRGIVVVAVLLLTGCGGGQDNAPAGGTGSAAPAGAELTGQLTVFAAASLTESFDRIGQEMQARNPQLFITFNYGGSSGLATQINEGAPADVFAAASPATMATVADRGNTASAPVVFARNQLVIAVAKGNPKKITGLSDLTRPELKVALCAKEVPCGAAATTALAGVTLTPVTLEQDVKAALAKVKLGEVDAALVYRTDARASASDVDGVEFPESATAINDYPIAVLKDAPNPAAAESFIAYVRAEGLAVLTDAGFQAP